MDSAISESAENVVTRVKSTVRMINLSAMWTMHRL